MSDDTLDVVSASPVLRAVQAAIFARCAELMAAALAVISGRTLDTAQGVNLDTIGRIVGLWPRPGIDSAGIIYFSPDAPGHGADVAGAFVTGAPTSGTVPVDDVRYRTLLRAQIAKNHTRHGSAPEILNYGLSAFGVPISAHNDGLCEISITLPSSVTAEQVAAITWGATDNTCDNRYALPLPTSARLYRVRFRPPSPFTPDVAGRGADVAPVGVSHVLNP